MNKHYLPEPVTLDHENRTPEKRIYFITKPAPTFPGGLLLLAFFVIGSLAGLLLLMWHDASLVRRATVLEANPIAGVSIETD